MVKATDGRDTGHSARSATASQPATSVIDKTGLLSQLSTLPRVALELGCGANKRDAASIGVDALELPGVDLVGDVFDVLAAFPTASVDAVGSYHFFEHVDDIR